METYRSSKKKKKRKDNGEKSKKDSKRGNKSDRKKAKADSTRSKNKKKHDKGEKEKDHDKNARDLAEKGKAGIGEKMHKTQYEQQLPTFLKLEQQIRQGLMQAQTATPPATPKNTPPITPNTSSPKIEKTQYEPKPTKGKHDSVPFDETQYHGPRTPPVATPSNRSSRRSSSSTPSSSIKTSGSSCDSQKTDKVHASLQITQHMLNMPHVDIDRQATGYELPAESSCESTVARDLGGTHGVTLMVPHDMSTSIHKEYERVHTKFEPPASSPRSQVQAGPPRSRVQLCAPQGLPDVSIHRDLTKYEHDAGSVRPQVGISMPSWLESHPKAKPLPPLKRWPTEKQNTAEQVAPASGISKSSSKPTDSTNTNSMSNQDTMFGIASLVDEEEDTEEQRAYNQRPAKPIACRPTDLNDIENINQYL